MRSWTLGATLVRASAGVLALSAVAAAQLAPIDAHRPTKRTTNATLGRFNLQSLVGSMRFAATQQMELAFHAASRVGDSSCIAQTADESGLAIWRRNETTINRAMVTDARHVQLQTSMRWQRGHAVDFVATFAIKIEPPTGTTDYLLALERFRMAEAVEPSNLRYSRHLFMVLAEGRRWEELLAMANARAARSPFDAQARFARGLALQRTGRGREASASFDSASAMLDDVERDRLFRLDRSLPLVANVLTGARGLDTSGVSRMSPAQRAAVAALYWAVHDPVIATAEGELRVEFVARVVQAELRWTDDELGAHGADTDRGDIFVRTVRPTTK